MKQILAAAALGFFASQSAALAEPTILGDFTFNVTIDKASALPGTKTYCGVEATVSANGVSITDGAQVSATGNKCKILLPVRWPKSVGGTVVNFNVSVYSFTSAKPLTTLRSFRSATTLKLPSKGGLVTKKYELRF